MYQRNKLKLTKLMTVLGATLGTGSCHGSYLKHPVSKQRSLVTCQACNSSWLISYKPRGNFLAWTRTSVTYLHLLLQNIRDCHWCQWDFSNSYFNCFGSDSPLTPFFKYLIRTVCLLCDHCKVLSYPLPSFKVPQFCNWCNSNKQLQQWCHNSQTLH